jgi:hypothetical protein
MVSLSATPYTPTPQHCNHDELNDDDEVLQPKLSIHLGNFNTSAMLLEHGLGVSILCRVSTLKPSVASVLVT